MQRKPLAFSDDPTTVAHQGKGSTAYEATGVSDAAILLSAGAKTLLGPPEFPDDLGKIDRYRVLGILGEGGMGVVFHALDPMANREIAIKVMVSSDRIDTESKARFLREARAMAAIQNENVIPILHVDETDTSTGTVPFLVMPLLKGETLSARLADGALPVATALRVARGIALGLSAAHERGLIHRDVKPSNVWLMEGSDQVQLLDFGLARELHAEEACRTQSGTVLGTPMYMAPEQADGLPADERSDVYGVGVVLYEMVTGIQAFSGPSLASIIKRVADHVPTSSAAINPEVSRELSDLIDEMLSKQPAKRPPSARAVADRLEQIAGRSTSREASRRRTKPTKKPWRTAAAAALLIVGCAAVSAAFWWFAGGTRPVAESQTINTKLPGGPGASDAEIRGFIDVRVWPDQTTFEAGQPGNWLADDGVLPLQAGDFMNAVVQVTPEPAYLYVIWLESDGDVVPIYPWKDQDFEQLPTHSAQSHLELPGELGASPSGIETLLLLVRERPLTSDGSRQLADLLRNLPSQSDLPSNKVRIWTENGRPTTDRGAIQVSNQGVLALSSVNRRLQSAELQELFPYTRAVSFSFKGE